MDADNATTVSVSASVATNNKKDAIISKGSKEVDKQDVICISDNDDASATCGIQIQQNKNKTDEIKTNVSKAATTNKNELKEVVEVEEADELLEKIEEVVKNSDITSSIGAVEDDISKASEQDFLKKIDEEMKDSDDSESTLLNEKLSKNAELICNSNENNKNLKDEEKENPIDGVIVNKKVFAVEQEGSEDLQVEKENPIDGVIVNKKIFAVEQGDNENLQVEKENPIDGVIVNKEVFAVEQENDDVDVTDKSSVNIEKENEKSLEIHKNNSSRKTEVLDNLSISNVATQSLKQNNIIKEISNKVEIQTTNTIRNQDVENSVEENKSKDGSVPVGGTKQQQPPLLIDLSKNEEPMCVDSNGNSNDKMDVDSEGKLEMDVDDENGSVTCNDEEMKSVEGKVIDDMNKKVVAINENQFGKVEESGLQIQTKDNLVNITVNVNVNAAGVPNSVNQSIDKNAILNKTTEKEENIAINVNKEKTNSDKSVECEGVPKTLEATKTTYQKSESEVLESNKSELEKKSQCPPLGSSELQSSVDKVLPEISTTKINPENPPDKENVHETLQKETIETEKDSSASIPNNKKDKADPIGKSNPSEKIVTTPLENKTLNEEKDEVILIDDSSSEAVKTDNSNATIETTEKLSKDDNKIENKFLSKVKGDRNVLKPESESLTSSPLPPPQANVFNSTPIAKQFEISSENVSQISNASENISRCDQNLGEGTSISESQKVHQKPGTSTMQTTNTTTTTTTTTTSESESYCPTSETDHQSSDGISKFISSIKNGMGDTTTDDGTAATSNSKIEVSADNKSDEHEVNAASVACGTSSLMTDKPGDSMYEVNLWYEKMDVKFLSVEKLERNRLSVTIDKAAGDSSGQGSSNGSVSSLPQFSLPSQRAPLTATITALSSSGSTSENSEKLADDKFNSHLTETNKVKHLIKGLPELCTFIINHFTKLQSDINPDKKLTDGLKKKEHSELTDDENVANSGRGRKRKLATTPKPKTSSSSKDITTKRGKQLRQSQSPVGISDSSSPVSKEGRSSKMSCESPISIGGKVVTSSADASSSVRKSDRSRKRSISKVISDDDEDDSKPKAKQAKKTSQNQTKTATTEVKGQNENSGLCVLAKWVADKKYYAGRIVEAKSANKFVVRFEDGVKKELQKDLIVFGNEDGTLPLKDHKIHALVDDDYESGIVISVDKVDNKVLYTVKAETATVKVTASNIYLKDDEAKAIQNLQNTLALSASLIPGLQDLSSSVVSGGLADTSSTATSSSTRHTRQKRMSDGSPITTIAASPEPGTSVGGSTTPGIGKKAKRQKRSTISRVESSASKKVPELSRISESSDITDTSMQSDDRELSKHDEYIEGLQQEYQKNVQEICDQKMYFIYEYRSINSSINIDDLLGVVPKSKSLFKNKCFLLTCTVGLKPYSFSELDLQADNQKRNMQFSKIPYIRNYLEMQILEGGGKIYNNFNDIPKSKYRSCILIAPRPCCTAKYIQCLAANIQAISHEWIIDCCKENTIIKKNEYILPSGWSIILNKFIKWSKGKTNDYRQSTQPFRDIYILIASKHENFVQFWSNICKLAGGIIRYIKTINDITETTQGFMVTDSDFSENIRCKAEHFGIPIVSSVWIVQSLIMGEICSPQSHIKLSCTYSEDDEYIAEI